MDTFRAAVLDHDRFVKQLDLVEPDLPLAVGVIDLDGFGALNESEGPERADAVLGEVERALVAGLPEQAIVGHVRGDEFCAAVPDAAPEELLIALDGVRRAVAAHLPLSAGVAGRPTHGAGADELLSAADTALVRAKQAGGDRVLIATEERMVLKTSYYSRPALHRLAKLAARTGRTEASLLREALDALLEKNRTSL
jgi:diguanylate cyclase